MSGGTVGPVGTVEAKQQVVLALRSMQARIDALERERSEPIALIGAACRFPGGVHDLASFRELLEAGVDAVSDVPPSRWDVEAYYSPEPATPGRMYTRRMGWVEGVDLFDPAFFGIGAREAARMDPQHRLLLEAAWLALEDAGQAPGALSGSSTGVFAGISTSDYAQLALTSMSEGAIDAYASTSAAFSVAAGRISYILGLQGPAIALDTACSSSLVAVHLAVQSLRLGDCRMALAGGVNLILSPVPTVALCQLRMMAPDGRCKTFDAAADGYVRGEGCGLVVLKRLSDARRDRDRVLAVIRGSAVNQDGRSGGMTAPSGPAQEAVIRRALANARVEAREVGYVEAHGTGTALGDPIEMNALGAVYCAGRPAGQPLRVGSVKTNLGHLEAAAGIAGLLKAVVAVGSRAIPPHLHLTRPSPHIPWERLPVEVPTVQTPWGSEGRRVAGVSSFGFSGTNAHVILEEPPEESRPEDVRAGEGDELVLPLSARTEPALRELAGRTRELLAGEVRLGDASFTAATGRAPLPLRIAVVGRTRGELREGLDAFLRGENSPWLVAPGRATETGRSGGGASAEARPLAERWVEGAEVDWRPLFAGADVRRVPLPAYPFQRIRCWMEGLGPAAGGAPGPAIYDLAWVEAEASAGPARIPHSSWRILRDEESEGLAASLAARLEEAGGTVALQAPGDPGPVTGSPGLPEAVVLLASTGGGTLDTSLPERAAAAALACRRVVEVLQALTSREAGPSRFVVVTRGGAAASGGAVDAVDPVSASVAALSRTLLAEHPELSPSLVDLDPDEPPSAQALSLAGELLGSEQNDGAREVAIRRGRRLVPRLVERVRAAGVPSFRPVGTVLITGGLGALGLALAARLVGRGVRSLLLAGRRGEDEVGEDARRTLTSLRAAGALVRVVRTDVTVREEVERLFEAPPDGAWPPVTAIFHAAGALSDGLLVNQGAESVATAFGAKALGAALLDEATRRRGLPLDAFVLFSSAAALLGPPGQGSYAAANAFLWALARGRRAAALPALSVAWGPWAGDGMAGRAGRRSFAGRGLGLLASGAALDALDRLLAQGAPEGAVLALDGPALAGIPRAILPDVLRGLVPPGGAREETAAGGATVPLLPELPRRLLGVPAEARPAAVVDFVRGEVAGLLGFAEPEAIDTRRGFFDLGLDSLLALELRSRLQAALGEERPLPSTVILDHPTVESLASRLLEEVGAGSEGGVVSGSGSGSGGARAGRTSPSALEPIAIVGLAVRFPGAPDVDSFRALLAEGRDAVTEVPATRWDVDALYDADPDAPGKMATRWGGFLEGVESFDARFFGITPREAASIDPQHRLLLEETWHALEDAGIPAESLEGTRTAVFVGISGNDYGPLLAGGDRTRVNAHFGLGNCFSAAAGRISYSFGLTGPAVALDTACSSSLVALHQAAGSLRAGESSLALAAGVNLILSPEATINLSRARMMAADGRCKTFDARADGYVRGEGCGVVVLERLSDALAAGHPVRAILLGSAVNQDGRSAGLTAPNGPAQEAVLEEALASAGVAPAEVDYVEAHGTGTSLGDPIELHAMGSVYGRGRPVDRPLLTGSVKTNFGHLEAAAGMAGLAKAVLALEAGEIPPHLHLATPNPLVDWDRIPVRVPTSRTPWPAADRPRRAAVSSFGFIGTNAHAVLEAATPRGAAAGESGSEEAHLLVLSARSPEALRDLAARYGERLRLAGAEMELGDIAFTARAGRSTLGQRLAVAGRSAEEIAAGLAAFREGRSVPGSPKAEALERLGAAWARGEAVDLGVLDRGRSRRRVPLPLYPFRKERHWGPDRAAAPAPAASLPASLPALLPAFLGPALATALEATLFDSTWSAESLPFLSEHRIHGRIVVPGAAHVALVLSAVRLLGPGPWRLTDVAFPEPLVLGETERRRVQLVLGPGESFRVGSRREGPAERFVLHAEGKVGPLPVGEAAGGTMPARSGPGEVVPGASLRDELALRGIALGPSFGWLESVAPGRGEARGRLAKPRGLDLRGLEGTLAATLHPGLLDSIFQLVAAALPGASLGSEAYVPFAIERFDVRLDVRLDVRVGEARLEVLDARVLVAEEEGVRSSVVASIGVADGEGRELLSIEGLTLRAAPREAFERLGGERPPTEPDLFELAWRPIAPPPGRTLDPPGRWLVVANSPGEGDRLAADLTLSGATGATATQVSALEQATSLLASDAVPAAEHVVFLAGEADTAAGADPFASCRRLFLLCQLLAGRSGGPVRLDVVTRGAQALPGSADPVSAPDAALWGLVRSLAQEHPALEPRLIDLPVRGAGAADTWEADLAAELIRGERSETQVALRPEGRFVARLAGMQRLPEPPALSSGVRLAMRKESTYLVTGGVGALGLHVAGFLLARGAGRVLLAGRSDPGPAAQEFVASSGGSVEFVRADVSREEEVERLLATVRRTDPPLAGVFHAAGVLDDGAMLRLSWERFESVLAAKARGALFLDRLTLGDPLDHFVLFSSAVSLLGAPGQASYAAANAALDALAADRRRRGLPGLSVSWGPWEGEGMAARAGEEARRLREGRGIGLIEPARGLELLERLLVAGVAHAVALPVRWDLLLRSIPSGEVPPFLAEVAVAAATATAVTAATPAVPGLPASWPGLLSGLPGPEARARLVALVREKVAAVMGLGDSTAVAPGVPLLEQGLDSLMTLELARALEEASGVPVPATTVFRHPTVQGMADHLAARLAPRDREEAATDVLPADVSSLGGDELRAALEKELADLTGE